MDERVRLAGVAALLVVAMVVAAALAVLTMSDVVRRLVIPRARASVLARLVGALVDGVFQLLVRRFADYEVKDRIDPRYSSSNERSVANYYMRGATVTHPHIPARNPDLVNDLQVRPLRYTLLVIR